MGLTRIFCCFMLLAVVSGAHAKPEFWNLFREHYQPPIKSHIREQACATCHTAVGQTARNPYGKRLEAGLDATTDRMLTMAILKEAEPHDSDSDGIKNLDEITAGSLPGNPNSRPGVDQIVSPTGARTQLIPKHSFHPTIVHFPLALFMFGAALDYWGARRKKPEARYGGGIAIWIGALTSLLAVPTGIAAWLRVGFDMKGNLLLHLGLGLTSAILMLAIAFWRRRGEPDSSAYWAALVITTFILFAAGHFGGLMVYG